MKPTKLHNEPEKIDGKKVKTLLKIYKRLIGRKQALQQHKQPIVLLIRRDGSVEYYEDQIGEEFEFEHSNGKDTKITLKEHKLLYFPYGDSSFRGYIIYEDEIEPYPQKPLESAESIKAIIEKITIADTNLNAKEIQARGEMYYKVAIGIALCLLALGIGYWIYNGMGAPPAQIIQPTTETIKSTVVNSLT